jgi:hypothetical protein
MRASGGRVQGTHGTVLAKSRGCGAPAQGYGQVSWARDGQTDASARGDRIEIAQDPAPTLARPGVPGPDIVRDSKAIPSLIIDRDRRQSAKKQRNTDVQHIHHTRPADPYETLTVPGGW